MQQRRRYNHPFATHGGNAFQIDQLNTRQLQPAKAFVQVYQRILANRRIVVAFYTWCGAAQQHIGVAQPAIVHGRIAGMVAGRGVLLFVAAVVFFVGNNEGKVAKGQKQCRPCTHHHLHFAGLYFVPQLQPLRWVKLRMIHRHVATQMLPQLAYDLGRERNFGQQKKALLALSHHSSHQMNVHHGFAAAGNAMQQAHFLGGKSGFHLLQGQLLRGAQGKIQIDQPGQQRQPVHHALFNLQHLLFHQPIKHASGHPALFQQLGPGYLPLGFLVMQKRQQQIELFGRLGPTVHQAFQRCFGVILRMQQHIQLSFLFVGLAQVFPHKTYPLFQQALHNGHHMAGIQYLLYFAQLQFLLQFQRFGHQVLAVAEAGKRKTVVGVKLHNAFAAQLQVDGQGGNHNFAFAAQVVFGYPGPQLQLWWIQHRLLIQQTQDGFYSGKAWPIPVNAFYDACIPFAWPHLHFYAAAGLYHRQQGFGQGPGERSGQVQRHNHVYKMGVVFVRDQFGCDVRHSD